VTRCPSASPSRARGRLRRWAFPVLLAPLALSSSANAETGPDVAGSERLSERNSTRWAHPKLRAPIRQLPAPTSRRIARVRHLTEDGFPEVYLVLRRWTDPDGRAWLKVRIPMRPNGQRGWVRESALGRLHLVRTRLVVDRGRLRATLYRRGRRIWRSPIGVGKPSTPTPGGRFWIRERIKVADPGGTYGPWAFGTSAYSRLSDWPGGGVVGIHGTNQPYLIPGRPSHGCIRVANRPIRQLARLMPIGTPVRIR
jgi:L,D-transpeptidase catalytic domain